MLRQDILMNIKNIYHNFGEVAVNYYLKENDININGYNLKVIFEDTSKIKWKSSKTHFTKMYDNTIKEMVGMKIVDLTELGLLTLLASYTDYENNELKLDEDIYLTQKDIIKLSGLSKTKIINMLSKFIECKFIFTKRHPKDFRKNIYYLNPELFFKGQKIDKEIKEVFNNLDNQKDISNILFKI